jgi:HD superfamily phosphohydrolase
MYSSGKLLMDPLHGGIPLNHLEVSIIDHPLMQRLRHISQNDVLQYSFPGATHNRFSHSIGSMHVAGQLYDSAIQNTLTGFRKLSSDPTAKEKRAIDYFRQAVRLAVLLHDTGHGPFSHQSERCESLRAIIGDRENAFIDLWEGIDETKSWYSTTPAKLHHEHYSVRMGYEILKDTAGIEKSLRHDIISLLDSTDKSPSDVFKLNITQLPEPLRRMVGKEEHAAENWMQVLSSFVSGVMDADRLDYLMRDTLYTGAKYADLSLDLICNSVAFHRDATNWFGIIIREQAAGAVEDFLHARMRMYRQVYQHKTARGSFGYILHGAIKEVLLCPDFKAKVEAYSRSPKKFFALTDNLFWAKFAEHAMDNEESMCARLIHRRSVKHLLTTENEGPERVEELKKELAVAMSIDCGKIVVMTDRFSFAPKPGSPKADRLRILDKHPLKPGAEAHQLSVKMPLYSAFAKGCEIHTFLYHPERGSN